MITDKEMKEPKDFLEQYNLDKTNDTSFLTNIVLKEPVKSSELNTLTRKIARKITGMRLGIALGGGAAFGLSQIGVLKVLEREGISVDMVSGTSIGSLVGALWASGVSAANIEKATEEFDSLFNMFKLFDFSMMPSKGLITGNNIRKFLEGFLDPKELSQQKVGEIVLANPNAMRVFTKFGIDFCCGGKLTLDDFLHSEESWEIICDYYRRFCSALLKQWSSRRCWP